MSAYSLSYVCEKEEVEKQADETISDLPKRVQDELLSINWDTVYGGDGTFGKGINLSVFYCLCFVEEISVNIAEKQAMEERNPNIEQEEDLRISNDWVEHWKEVEEKENEERGKFHSLRWEVYMKQKEELKKREFSVAVPHPKGGGV